MEAVKELTAALCALPGPSGYESPVFDTIKELLAPLADEIRTDALGNLLAVKRCGRSGADTLLLEAHMDEIGLVVTAAEDGYLRFAAVGGVDPRLLPAREVQVLSDPPLFGVIGAVPPHLLSAAEMEKAVPVDKLCIDVGLSQEEAEKRCPPGTAVVFTGAVAPLGDGLITGKALDNRACAAIVLKIFEALCAEPLKTDLALLISTQEEIGGRGAVVGAYSTDPERAIVLDTTFAKQPDAADIRVELGKGPAVGIGPNMDRRMTADLIALAGEKEIPFQREVCPGSSGTDAEDIQISRGGVRTALVSLPIRYMHTSVETACAADMENTVRLVTEYVKTVGEVL